MLPYAAAEAAKMKVPPFPKMPTTPEDEEAMRSQRRVGADEEIGTGGGNDRRSPGQQPGSPLQPVQQYKVIDSVGIPSRDLLSE